jgi:hypothetical protein
MSDDEYSEAAMEALELADASEALIEALELLGAEVFGASFHEVPKASASRRRMLSFAVKETAKQIRAEISEEEGCGKAADLFDHVAGWLTRGAAELTEAKKAPKQ